MSASAPSIDREYTRAELLSGDTDVRQILATSGRPEYRVLMSKQRSDEEKELARGRHFIVFPTIDAPTLLAPPVDWKQDPFSSRSWRAQLHSMRFLDILFQMYIDDGDCEALDRANEGDGDVYAARREVGFAEALVKTAAG